MTFLNVYLQFVVTANDLNAAACTASVSVTVTVNRNPNYPYFLSGIYRVRISEYTPVNTMVQQVVADDDDPEVSPGGKIFYRFGTGIQNEDIRAFFTLSQTTGEIFVAKQLTTRINLPDRFNVSI